MTENKWTRRIPAAGRKVLADWCGKKDEVIFAGGEGGTYTAAVAGKFGLTFVRLFSLPDTDGKPDRWVVSNDIIYTPSAVERLINGAGHARH